MEKLIRLRVGTNEFLRISRGTQFHLIWDVSELGDFHNEAIHLVDLEGNDFDFDDENIFKATNVDDSLILDNYLILDIERI